MTTTVKNTLRETECYFFTSKDMVFPQCGQVIVFGRSFSSATSSETDMPMMSAISCNLSNGVFPLRSCDKEDCDMPCFPPLLFVISDASLSSVQPCSFITFLISILFATFKSYWLATIRTKNNICSI